MVAQNMLRTIVCYRSFPRNKIEFDDSFDVSECPQAIDTPDLLPIWALCSELPSNINTMVPAAVNNKMRG